MLSRIVPLAIALVVVTLIGVGIFFVFAPRVTAPDPSAPLERESPAWALPIDLPPGLSGLPARDGVAGYADEEWVLETAAATGVPTRALAAYAGVAIWKSTEAASCGLSWATLAAIGAVESDHGRHGGSAIRPNGQVEPPIFGVALDGDGVAFIPDSDGGQIDGDAELDRAVGPMQLIPQAWRNWHVDANSDGVEDPQHIDDAVMAAANYLCRTSSDVMNEQGWRTAIGAYNPSDAYIQLVADVANRLAEDAGVAALL